MTINYNSQTLDIALACSKSSTLEERKKGEKILRQATCLEIGTKNTIPIREWFVSHTDDLLIMIRAEKDSRLLWGYIYTLQLFCSRYIGMAYSLKNSEDFLNDSRTKYFEKQALYYVQSMASTENMQVLQAVGSFLWTYYDSRAWDIFIQVLRRKKDKLTLAHITKAVGNCHRCIINEKQVCNFDGDPLDDKQLMSKEQATNIRARFQILEAKTVPSKFNKCSIAISQLDDILERISL